MITNQKFFTHVTKHRSERQIKKLMFVNIIALAKLQCTAINIKQVLYNWDSSPGLRAIKFVCEILRKTDVQAAP